MLIKTPFDDDDMDATTTASEDFHSARADDTPPGYSASQATTSTAARYGSRVADVKAAYRSQDEYSLQTTAGDDAGDGSPGATSAGTSGSSRTHAPNEPPPSFVPYHASFSIDQTGNITTHDRHLNQDPEALSRFLMMHLKNPPDMFIQLHGSHTEVSTETVVHRDNLGNTRHESRERRETVVDFSFNVKVESVTNLADPGVKLFIVGDDEIVHRGGVFRERQKVLPFTAISSSSAFHEQLNEDVEQGRGIVYFQHQHLEEQQSKRVRVSRRQRKVGDQVAAEQTKFGFPPFLPSDLFTPTSRVVELTDESAALLNQSGSDDEDSVVVQEDEFQGKPQLLQELWLDRRLHARQDDAEAATAIRKWCEEYCANTMPAKRFVARRLLFGWNLDRLHHELEALVRQTGYEGRVEIKFTTTGSKLSVFPDTPLSRMLTLHWSLKLILTLVMIYPVVWLLVRFKLGPRWDGIRSAVALSRYQVVPPRLTFGQENEEAQSDQVRVTLGDEQFSQQGMREMEWLQRWQSEIASAINRRARGVVDLTVEGSVNPFPQHTEPPSMQWNSALGTIALGGRDAWAGHQRQ